MAFQRNSRNFIRNYLTEIDLPLLATTVAISLFSILNMYGISGSSSFFTRQIVFVAIGLAVMMFLSLFNYRYLKNYSFPVMLFYGVSILLLVLAFYSKSVRGVRSWIVLGSFTLEPSELAKLMFILLMAKYFSRRHIHINEFKHIIISGIYFLPPVLIILAQPDLGSAIIFILVWISMLIAVGINKKHFFLLMILGLVVAYGSWLLVLKPYQKDRIITFLNPNKDPHGSGYNLIQSKTAIGSGYIFGNGLGRGSQATLGFLPEPHNDFVFAAAAEQFGFLGVTAILTLVFAIISRILSIGRTATSNFGKLFAVGMAVFVFSHALIGAAVNIGLMPITGIPFPFLSYGGSYFISLAIGLGILQSIKRYG